MAAITTYKTILMVDGNRTVLNFTSERKTVSALVKAVMACRDQIIALVPEADLNADSFHKSGKFYLGNSYVFFEA